VLLLLGLGRVEIDGTVVRRSGFGCITISGSERNHQGFGKRMDFGNLDGLCEVWNGYVYIPTAQFKNFGLHL
jgi:hypothetical protein